MPEQLVAAVRLRRVERVRRVADVLRAVEDAEGEPGQEVARRQVPGDGAQLKPGSGLQKAAHVLQLRQVVLAVAAVLDQRRPVLHVLGNGVHGVEPVELCENDAPAKRNQSRFSNRR